MSLLYFIVLWCCVLYSCIFFSICFFFFKQKTAYEMRISDWSSDVCSSDLLCTHELRRWCRHGRAGARRTRLRLRQEIPIAYPASGGREIGRASCRESVSVRVDLGGRRIIKKKT